MAYSITDDILSTVRYGYARPIDHQLGTGGCGDLPLDPGKDYNLVQLDLTWRF